MPYTLVTFHAHPDDEAIATGGIMARAAAEGHRVVLVVATRGELGEVDDGFLDPGETLAERRVVETGRAAEALGVARVEFLGYTDSGMDGEPTNDAQGSFWSADLDEAAGRLAAILDRGTGRRAHRVRRPRRLRPPRPRAGAPGRRARRRARGNPARLRVDDEPRPHPAPDGCPARRPRRRRRRARPVGVRRDGLAGIGDHDDRRRARLRRAQARRDARRTRARSPSRRSSCRCPTKRSARRSAGSGSSAAATDPADAARRACSTASGAD